nr:MAG TPA: hypothetical protein [Caudoviricetes sp.]
MYTRPQAIACGFFVCSGMLLLKSALLSVLLIPTKLA